MKHIDNITETELKTLIENWNLGAVTISEKIDGSYMSFGIDENFFLKSKNIKFDNEPEIPNIFFYDDFRKYFLILSKLPLENITSNLKKKYNLDFNITFEGEAVPHFQHNIITYKPEKVNGGAFVLFKTFAPENDEFWNDLVSQLNKFSLVKFHILPNLDYSFTLDTNQTVQELKSYILTNITFDPIFGNDFEGLVIKQPNGQLTKIVDKDKFNKLKEVNWAYINRATKLKNTFKNKTKKDISKLKEFLTEWKNDLETLETEFRLIGTKTFTIKKKIKDTQKYLDFCQFIISSLSKRLINEPVTEVFKAFMEKRFEFGDQDRITEKKHNVFEDQTISIPKNIVKKTTKSVLKTIGFETIPNIQVGNKNVPMLNDLDIALSRCELEKIIGVEKFWDNLDSHLTNKQAKYRIIKGLKQFHILHGVRHNQNNQIDFFVGNINWMEKVLSGKPENSAYKACFRNIFLRSIFDSLRWQTKDGYVKTSLDWKEGIIFRKEKIIEPSGKQKNLQIIKEKEKVLITNADTMTRFLFGKGVGWSDIDSFEKLYSFYTSNMFRYKSFRHVINQSFIVNLKEDNLKVPREFNLGAVL